MCKKMAVVSFLTAALVFRGMNENLFSVSAVSENAVKVRDFGTKQFNLIHGKAYKFFVHVMWYVWVFW